MAVFEIFQSTLLHWSTSTRWSSIPRYSRTGWWEDLRRTPFVWWVTAMISCWFFLKPIRWRQTLERPCLPMSESMAQAAGFCISASLPGLLDSRVFLLWKMLWKMRPNDFDDLPFPHSKLVILHSYMLNYQCVYNVGLPEDQRSGIGPNGGIYS